MHMHFEGNVMPAHSCKITFWGKCNHSSSDTFGQKKDPFPTTFDTREVIIFLSRNDVALPRSTCDDKSWGKGPVKCDFIFYEIQYINVITILLKRNIPVMMTLWFKCNEQEWSHFWIPEKYDVRLNITFPSIVITFWSQPPSYVTLFGTYLPKMWHHEPPKMWSSTLVG